MKDIKDLTNKRFDDITVISFAERRNNHIYWYCKCDCGKFFIIRSDKLKTRKSCGCKDVKKNTNPLRRLNPKLYRCWEDMKRRCYRTLNPNYKYYGGRGIKVCEEWLKDFMSFYNWAIQNGYNSDLSIDRIDVNGNYEPKNCRWATKSEQQRNTRKYLKK